MVILTRLRKKRYTEVLRQKPIFDTNIFGDVQNGSIPQSDWLYLLHYPRAKNGWPLSLITVLELLAGLDGITSERFPVLREQVGLAFALSQGRVLEDPMPLICTDVLRIPFPEHLLAPAAQWLSTYMDVVRRASTAAQLLHGVPYKGGRQVMEDPSAVKQVVQSLKHQWTAGIEGFLTAICPSWREHHEDHGKRLPLEMRIEREPMAAWLQHERDFITNLLRAMLKKSPDPATVDTMMQKFDAVLKFTTSVVRDFSVTNYSIQKRASDALDQFQLRYLALDKFVIVTQDALLSKRTARSSQADRIMTFQKFLGML
jgi:hypothetical protein